ncbi:hypothetical protein EBR66_01840 [bacterium]|nr:hypothetical protein [bacterium]
MKKKHSAELDQVQFEELRSMLEAERDSLLEELATYGVKKDGDWQGSSLSPEGEESDPIDAADQIEELSVNVPLVEELEKRLKEVNAAVAKMEKGGYGIDEDSGEDIPFDRLMANPAARTNVEE